jgi:hypothetical protein
LAERHRETDINQQSDGTKMLMLMRMVIPAFPAEERFDFGVTGPWMQMFFITTEQAEGFAAMSRVVERSDTKRA